MFDHVAHRSLRDAQEGSLDLHRQFEHVALRVDFIDAYDAAVKDRSQVAYTMGLFWIRPESFMAGIAFCNVTSSAP